MDGASPPSFIEVSDQSINIVPTSNEEVGIYEVEITVTDQIPENCDCDSLTDTISFSLVVTASDETIVDENDYDLANIFPYAISVVPTPDGEEPPKWSLESVSSTGLLTIVFTQNMHGIPDAPNLVDFLVI